MSVLLYVATTVESDVRNGMMDQNGHLRLDGSESVVCLACMVYSLLSK